MKLYLITLSLILTALPSWAEYRTWTNAEGVKAELELFSVKEFKGEKYGVFRMKSGKTVNLRSSQLNDADSKALAVWKPSVFEDIFEGNLVKLQGDKLQPYNGHQVPSKYYVFYYTAYWCPPCRAFTPSLVKWYKQNKNDNFELVLISSDREKSAMEQYAKEKKMPWPQLDLDKSREFKGNHDHGVRGIPSLIVCDLQGKVLGNYRSKLDELTQMVR